MKTQQTSTAATTINPNSLGTGNFAQPAISNGPAFAMSSTEWQSLQTFFANVALLPSTTAALATQMGSGAPSNMSDFQQLITLYVSMQGQGTNFTQTLFPNVVSVAGDIANYGNSIGTYYGGLQTLINQLQSASPAQQPTIQANIIALVKQLADTAQNFGTNATNVKNNLITLSTNLTNDSGQLIGTNGLYNYYNNKYGATSTTVQNLLSEISSDNSALSSAREEYKHDVIVAATSPTYCWVAWPVGMIAAAIVAGIYGKKATDELKVINSLQDTIATLTAQEQADTNLMTALQTAYNGCLTLNNQITGALKIVEEMAGGWSTISSDLNNIVYVLNNDFNSGLAFLEQINYNALIQDWTTLATLATTFQTKAFITVNS
ncbi:MAG: alpha-xenorhabdolysin family binary toxin subunit A [Bacteroidia bacterium]|nr:alpha-xenorhabdolysin family binary toxin subunit A [Bacteroidia bacterium]